MYMTQGLHRSMQQRPQQVAIRYEGKEITYAQLGDRVARLAGALRGLGVQDGDRVAMFALNCARYVEYYMAVPWAGAVLNPVNIRWSAAEILYSLEDSGTGVLIVDENFKDVATAVAADCKHLRHVIYAGDGETPPGMLSYEALIADAEPIEDRYRHGGDLAGIFYTGGTTGFPKGVMLSHAGLLSSATNAIMFGLTSKDARVAMVMPLFHLAMFSSINIQMMVGGSIIAVPSFDPGKLLQTISDTRATEMLLAPTMFQMLIDWLERNPDRAASLDLSSLTHLRYGASPMSLTLLQRARAAFPNAGFAQGYGMTEMSPVVTVLGPEHHNEESLANGRMGSVGVPAFTVEIRIVDPEGREVPRGTVGEITVRGPGVMLGYWNKPEATADAIRDGWMHTGDGGYMDEDGFLFLKDRIKDMIISGGENVYSAEVENALASHPDVSQSAVIGVPHERWGEAVHAVIVPKPGTQPTLESIQAHCRTRIAGYKIPRSVELRESLPTSGVGKVLKAELRKSHQR
ncbi:long-chain-fatty-acid--CoA ligase [Cupriavidus sp. NPDC089707]|uniref:long-chain-fatty-acid--CoA ligase n=1 Tax=Cupriavidus sp. NPDC089707 TaxID=3363963 RepID=UPI0038301630